MKVFDFNIHLPWLKSDDVNDVIYQDMNLSQKEVIVGFDFHQAHINQVDGANVLLFNPNLFDEVQEDVNDALKKKLSLYECTHLVDFRRQDCRAYLEKAKEFGISAIMFNSYLQKIAPNDYASVIAVCKIAQELNLIVCIDGSYGTSKMYTYKNLELACLVADIVTEVPIVIVHSGGSNVIDAMHLALDKKNVWLDTSFSLPFYLGSSLERDFAFVYKKMDCERIVFGSDHPYMDLKETIDLHINFFDKYQFGQHQIDNIMFYNAQHLFSNK